jgi:OPA family glycerol-3-phosphate transporter-like MFS transporter
MVLVLVAVLIYWFNPAGNPNIDIAALMAIGFLIYGPVMLIGLYALELVPKKSAGTAAVLTGLFGYLGGALVANIALGYTVDAFGWDGGFILLVGGCIMAIVLIGMTVQQEIDHKAKA